MLQIPLKLLKTTFILSIINTRYLGGHCCRDIRVQRFHKPPSNEFLLSMLQISLKLLKTTFILSTLGTIRYLRGCCRDDIRV
ncbi:hypothetical protein TSAR_008843 [Trichomalopsis sarcophagae]|uniref:Uncharacterized protein n=1 Tax=Trichomalopsis sarcophagae TaxID=543379 RepID=A0A232ENH7_9HYME|nr:hypothetical protein TSAR_008843 [Trichomalopsis sarcophagae]